MNVLLNIAVATGLADPAPPPMPAFLTGCWEQRHGERWAQECWTEPRAGQMMGSARSGTGDKLQSWEFMRIERALDGGLTFYGSPGGAPPHPFRLLFVTGSSVEFVDPDHDFPQRILYKRKGDDLAAEVSLKNGTKPIRWSYRRSGAAKP